VAWRFEKNAAVVVEGCLRQGSLACFLTRPWSQPPTTGSPRNVQRSSIPNKKAPDVVLHEAKRFSFLASDHLASRMGHRNDRYNICVLMRICGFPAPVSGSASPANFRSRRDLDPRGDKGDQDALAHRPKTYHRQQARRPRTIERMAASRAWSRSGRSGTGSGRSYLIGRAWPWEQAS